MKRLICGVLTLTLMSVLLTACAGSGSAEDPIPETTRPVQTEPITQPPETTQPAMSQSWFRDTPAHQAFREVLRVVHDELYWPESGGIEIDLWDGDEAIEEEKFAVCDVDGDGEDELLISVAGMYEIIYGYDAGTGGVRMEASVFPSVTHYLGVLRVNSSHSHGYAGDVIWPYGVWVYDGEEDVYTQTCSVDAWDKAITDYDPYREIAFPEDIDTEGNGFVYIIGENGEERMVNQADYEAWESALFAQLEPLEIPWQKMTSENIGIG